MGNYVFQVWLDRKNTKGEAMFILFRCAIETIDEFIERLNEGNLILGETLFTRFDSDEEGKFNHITHKRPEAIGKAGITRVCIPSFRVIEFTDE